MQKEVVIVSAKRTPIGRFLGSFSNIPAPDLGAEVTKSAIKEANISPEHVDLVIFGHARQAGCRPNPARQVQFKAGIPLVDKTAYTINQVCDSSIKAITLAYQEIVSGDADVVVAGGMENMTRTPFILDRMRPGYRLGNFEVLDGMYWDGLWCPLCEWITGERMSMGHTAEKLAGIYKIGRTQQDEFAAQSQQRCEKARKEGRFKDEIAPVDIPKDLAGKKVYLDYDEHPRDGVTVESLKKLPPVFKKDGTVTAGNACGICDAAAAVVVMSYEKAKELGAKPMAKIIGFSSAAVEPTTMGTGPVYAIKKLEKKTGMKLPQFDLVEINEAFAVQVLSCDKILKDETGSGFDFSRTNVNGGAIALGHPIGATGCRIVVTLLHEIQKRQVKYGLATLCGSGGPAMAIAFERL
jgi:acetyl-CoA C-acetyltransferase